MKIEETNRLPKFKDCNHEYRHFRTIRGYEIFYCVKCLLFCLKKPDELKGLKDYIKKLKGGKKNE